MVTTNVFERPLHGVPPFVKVGVTVIVAEIGALLAFVAVNDKLLIPLAARPMDVLSFVQE